MKLLEAMEHMKLGNTARYDGVKYRTIQIIKYWRGTMIDSVWEVQRWNEKKECWCAFDDSIYLEATMSENWEVENEKND